MSDTEEQDEWVDWGIPMPLVADDEDSAGFRIKNKPGETHRERITGWDRNPKTTAVRGRLFHVVHGYMADGSGAPATLIVFEWLLVPGKLGRRFREVQIDVVFAASGRRLGMTADEDLSEYDPAVKTVAPYVPIKSFIASRDVTKTHGKKAGLNVGYPPFVSVNPELSSESTESMERTDYRFIAGFPSYVNKNWGDPNSVHWTFQENAPQESGTPHVARTAVLLQRQTGDFGMFTAKFKTCADVSIVHNAMETIRRAIGTVPNDDPISFDPTPNHDVDHGAVILDGSKDVARRKSPFDKDNLGEEDLDLLLIKDDETWRVTKDSTGKHDK
jgi:hypothetical protein